ncbi:MAG: enoyl-CoA hydratase/isomerase family protein, partial [Burkholderiales bacterium]
MGFSTLELDPLEPGILRLTINRPKALNALSPEVIAELEEAVAAIAADAALRVLLVTGAGEKAFVAGADIAAMSQMTPLEGREFSNRALAVFRSLELLPIPVIALVNGYALGGGCELAMACDWIIASDQAQFGQPEVNLGICPGFGGTQRLTRLVGRARALELVCT